MGLIFFSFVGLDSYWVIGYERVFKFYLSFIKIKIWVLRLGK